MILDHSDEEKSIHLSDKEVFTSIWFSPRKVFRFILSTDYDRYKVLLTVLIGITSTLGRASSKSLGDTMSLIEILGYSFILGGALGWIFFYIYAAGISWTGKWLGGKANKSELFKVLIYGSLPSAVSLILLIPELFFFNIGFYQSDYNIFEHDLYLQVVFFAILALDTSLSFFSIILYIIGISEVNQLSIGKAILNFLFPMLIIVVPLVAISVLSWVFNF